MPTLQITLCEIVNLQELFLRKPLVGQDNALS